MADKLTLADLASLANETSAMATINNNNALIETALDNTLSRDGSTPNEMEASLDMNENRILNLPAPISDGEPVRLIDIVDIDDAINVVNGLSAFGVELMTSADATEARTTLELGTSATVDTGTSGATIPLLNGTNTHSGVNTFSNTTESTSTSTGAIVTAGGLGVAKDAFFGDDVNIADTLAVTGVSTLTGKVTVGAGSASNPPVQLTSGTVATTAQAGGIEYDGKAFYASPVASSRGLLRDEHCVYLLSTYTLTDTATAQKAFNLPTNGVIAVAANTTYAYEAQYVITNTGTNAHTWGVLFAVTTATISSGTMIVHGRTGTTSAATLTADQSAWSSTPETVLVSTASSGSSTENVILNVTGILRIGTGGSLTPQVKLSATTGGTIIMQAGSYFRMWPIGSDTATTVGNWS